MSPFSSKSVWRKKVKISVTFGHGDKDREAIEASRSDVIEDRGAIEASRSDSPGASQMMTRRGVKGEATPARHHRAIADAPPLLQLPSRVSIYLYIKSFKKIKIKN